MDSFAGLNGKSGFVIAPFVSSGESPIVLIHPEKVMSFGSHEEITEEVQDAFNGVECAVYDTDDKSNERETYGEDFRRCHSLLESGEFSKIVLARRTTIANRRTPFDMFRHACERYPRVFVALFASPWSGMWLVASPEILLEKKGNAWRTIALAGTMETQGGWSEKNIREQRYVATYISDSLRPFAKDLKEDGPRTVRAGHLVHLRSDFTFTTNEESISDIIEALHPTPAVCGLPKEQTLQSIITNEHCQRGYYTGFCGPLSISEETHLFVTLRCMEVGSNAVRLYAGGGLLKDSTEESEWQETEAKMQTMKLLFK